MKKELFNFGIILLLFCCFTLSVSAKAKTKKIEYASNIEYKGEVDDNKSPFGIGELFHYSKSWNGYLYGTTDYVRGNFNGNKITSGEIYMGKKQKYDPTHQYIAKFVGDFEFSVVNEGNHGRMIYKLKEGFLFITLKSGKEFIVSCYPEDACAIERYLSDTDVKQETRGTFHTQEPLSAGDVNEAESDLAGILKLSDIGEVKSKKKDYNLFMYGESWNIDSPSGYSLFFSNGNQVLILETPDNPIKIVNRVNHFTYTKKGISEIEKYYKDGSVRLHNSKALLFKVDGKQKLALIGNMSIKDLYQKLMLAKSIQETGMTLFSEEMTQTYIKAENGDPNALYSLAMAYREGKEFPKDLKYAQTLFNEARQKGYSGSIPETEIALQIQKEAGDDFGYIKTLAMDYEKKGDNIKAAELYLKLGTTSTSESDAIAAMDFFRKTNQPKQILKILESLSMKGNRDAGLRVGDIYRTGHDWDFKKSGITVTKNLATAVKWYQKAREAGSKAALFFMADCYWTGGTGIAQNRVQAAKLYKQLVDEAGLVNLSISEAENDEKSAANYRYGYCLENGIGVVKNIKAAWDFYSASNEADAYYRRGVMLEKRWVFETLRPDYRKKQVRELYQWAAGKGSKPAQQALNRVY